MLAKTCNNVYSVDLSKQSSFLLEAIQPIVMADPKGNTVHNMSCTIAIGLETKHANKYNVQDSKLFQGNRLCPIIE